MDAESKVEYVMTTLRAVLRRLAASTLVRTSTAQALAYGVQAISMFVISVIVARAGGPSMLGLFSFAITVTTAGRFLADFGLGLLLTRETSRNVAEGEARLHEALSLVALGAPLLIIAAVGLTIALPQLDPSPAAVPLAAVGLALFAFTSLFRGTFLGLERMGSYSAAIVLQELSFLIGGGLVVTTTRSLTALMVAYAASRLVGLAAAVHSYTKLGRSLRFSMDPRRIRALAVEAIPFATTAAFGVFYARSAILLLPLMKGSAAAGLFEAAFNLTLRLSVIVRLINNAFLPRMSRAALAHDPDAFFRVGRRAVVIVATIAVALTVFVAVFAVPLIRLGYGASFDDSAPLLRILALAMIPKFLAHVGATLLTASDHQRARAGIGGAVALIALPLQALMIANWGITGAAWATLLTEILLCLGHWWILIRQRA